MDAKTSIEIHENNVIYGCCPAPAKKIVVAGGSGANQVTYSYDGSTWIISPTGNAIFGSLGTCEAVAYNGKIWVMGGNTSTTHNGVVRTLGYSFDGVFWYPSPSINLFGSNGAGTCFAVASNGSMWVAGGSSVGLTPATYLAYSPDGISWTPIVTTVFSTTCNTVAWNGSIWVAGGDGTQPLAWSSDGITWTSANNPFVATSCLSVYWNGQSWLAGGNVSSGSVLATSTDGKTWTTIPNPSGVGTECHTISSNGTQWLIGIAANSPPNYPVILSSADGVHFTTTSASSLTHSGQCMSLLWTGTVWIAGGDDLSSKKILLSPDGLSWSITKNGDALFQNVTVGGSVEGSVRALATNLLVPTTAKVHPKFSSYSEYYVWKRVNAQKYGNVVSPCAC